jgi:hypothetical protein
MHAEDTHLQINTYRCLFLRFIYGSPVAFTVLHRSKNMCRTGISPRNDAVPAHSLRCILHLFSPSSPLVPGPLLTPAARGRPLLDLLCLDVTARQHSRTAPTVKSNHTFTFAVWLLPTIRPIHAVVLVVKFKICPLSLAACVQRLPSPGLWSDEMSGGFWGRRKRVHWWVTNPGGAAPDRRC